MFAVLDVLMHEETRHIVFFVNWMAYRETQRGRGAAPLRALTSLWYHGRAVARHLKDIRHGAGKNRDKADDESGRANFSATQADIFRDGFSPRGFLAECLAENARRMSAFEPELLRPQLMPGIARAALPLIALWPAGRAKAKPA
jgi:hypothetical protein